MEKSTELTQPPVIGQTYLVPVIMISGENFWDDEIVIPVLGDYHNDADIIGLSEDHFHVDWRFVDSLTFRRENRLANVSIFKHVWPEKLVLEEDWKPLVCRRKMPKFFYGQERSLSKFWMPDLERAYKDKKVECGRCPHRGVNLAAMNGDRKGNKICPGHGLQWDKNGNLVPRTNI